MRCYLPRTGAQVVDSSSYLAASWHGCCARWICMWTEIFRFWASISDGWDFCWKRRRRIADALDMLVRGEYAIERRMMLKVEGMCNGKPVSAYATNEVSVSRGLSQRMIALDALVGGTLVDHYIADGVVLASPTGSTAIFAVCGVGRLSARMCRALCSIRFVRIRCNRAPSCFLRRSR